MAKAKSVSPEPSALRQATNALSSAVACSARSVSEVENANKLVRGVALMQLQLTLPALEQALAAWKEAVNETVEVEGVLDILAEQATPSGAAIDSFLSPALFSTRAYNALTSNRIITVRDFCALEMGDFMKMLGCGQKTITEFAMQRQALGIPLVGWQY